MTPKFVFAICMLMNGIMGWRIASAEKDIASLKTKIYTLDSENKSLNGSIESINHTCDVKNDMIKSMFEDSIRLENKLNELDTEVFTHIVHRAFKKKFD